MSSCNPAQEFFTLAEVREFLGKNCQTLLPSASLYARRKIRYKIWHQAVPDPDEVVHVVFEKYWSGSRRMRKAVIPQTQVYLAIASVLSNLATNSENSRMISTIRSTAKGDVHLRAGTSECADEQTQSPDAELADREDCERLFGLLGGNDLDHRVLEFILDRSETTSKEFKNAVRPRTIANELRVTRHEIYRSMERMRRVFETLQPKNRISTDSESKGRRANCGMAYRTDRIVSNDHSRILARPKFMCRSTEDRRTSELALNGPCDEKMNSYH
jgi:hypothetical protein